MWSADQLPESERKRVMATPEFKEFFVSSTKLVSRIATLASWCTCIFLSLAFL